MQSLPLEHAEHPTLSASLDTLDDTPEPSTVSRRLAARFDAAGATHPGRVRSHNEDAYAIFREMGFCAVADGLGGRPGGEVASALAIHEARQIVARSSLTEGSIREVLEGAVVHANQAVLTAAAAAPRFEGMATTFVGLLFAGTRVAIAHAGDSRAYRVRHGSALRLTVDHSMRELYLQVFKDRADPRVAEQNAAIVTRALGARPQLLVDVRVEDVEPEDVYFLCSDGLWGLVDDDEIGFAVAGARTLEGALAKLFATAYNRGGHDNITGVLVRPPAASPPPHAA